MKDETQNKTVTTAFDIGDESQTLGGLLEQSERDGWIVIKVPSRAEVIPTELHRLDDDADVLLLDENSWPWRCTASFARFSFQKLIDRTTHHHYSVADLVLALSEQTGQSMMFLRDAVRTGYAKGQLRFWFPSGSPADCTPPRADDAMGDEYYLGLSGEYTTPEAVNEWLEQWGATYRLKPYRPKIQGKKQPQQQDLILTTIAGMGYDPRKLPPRSQGRSGVKAEVRKKLKEHPLFRGSKTAFDTAWKELGLKS